MINFTERELDIIRLVVVGKTNREIGNELFISFHTVKAFLEKIYEKVGCNNRVSLAVFAVKNGLVESD